MAGLSIITFIEPKPTITLLLQGLVVSGIYYSSFVISFKVLETKDVTKLQPLSSLSNVFLVVLSIVFLERVLTIGTYLGILLITLGSALSLSITSKGRLDLNKTIGIYMVGVLLASLYSFSVELILQDGYSPLLNLVTVMKTE